MNVNTVMELVQLAKDKPGALTYGSTGNGSPNHISGELLKYLAKIDAVHVPYKGSPEVVADLLAGQIDFGFDAAIIAQARAGKLKAIAVASNFRWPTDPTIPTIAESGFPDYDLSSFFGIVAPAKTATAIVEKLNEAFRTVALQPDLAEKLAVTATIPFPATLAETQAFLHDQSTRWASIVEASGAKVD
jgi:tripartite-type tricarboxylate transporter receptor subunit TctC